MEKIKSLLTSKIFWAAVTGLILIIVGVLFPGVADSADPELVTEAVLLIVAYIVGSAIDSAIPDLRPLAEKLKGLLASRKFWAALAGTVVVIIKQWKPDFPLSEEQITEIAVLLSAYILGVGIVDRTKASAGPIG